MKNIKDSAYVQSELEFAKELAQTVPVETFEEPTSEQVIETTESIVAKLLAMPTQLDFKPGLYGNQYIAEHEKGRVFMFVSGSNNQGWSKGKIQTTQESSIFDNLTEKEFKRFSEMKGAGKKPLIKFYEDKGNVLYFLAK